MQLLPWLLAVKKKKLLLLLQPPLLQPQLQQLMHPLLLLPQPLQLMPPLAPLLLPLVPQRKPHLPLALQLTQPKTQQLLLATLPRRPLTLLKTQ